MAYVVAEPCIRCRYTDCVEVCPVDCFHEGPNALVIDPEECIDCGACEPACPVSAIFEATALPAEWQEYVELNAVLSHRWPVISERRAQLPDADRWKDVKGKRGELDEGAPSTA